MGITQLTIFLVRTPFAFALLFFPLAISVALLRDRLWESTPLIRHILVAGLLIACLVVAYMLIVGGLGWLLQAPDNPLIALFATVVIVLLFHAVFRWLDRSVNRLFYGERDDPYVFFSRLGRHIEAAFVPQDVLLRIVETIAQALKLPFVAIAIANGQEPYIAAAYGTQDEQYPLVRIPLLAHHEQVGTLLCSPRQEEEALTEQDMHLLQDLALHIGAAVKAVQLSSELQRSREKLILAREEERRRLRRDLHDGLGPTLASLSQRIDAASSLVTQQPEEAVALLQTIKGQMRSTISDRELTEREREILYLMARGLNNTAIAHTLSLSLKTVQMYAAIQALPPPFRAIVWLRYEEELPFPAIAQRLNIPTTTAKTYFYRACKKLRAALLSQKEGSAPGILSLKIKKEK